MTISQSFYRVGLLKISFRKKATLFVERGRGKNSLRRMFPTIAPGGVRPASKDTRAKIPEDNRSPGGIWIRDSKLRVESLASHPKISVVTSLGQPKEVRPGTVRSRGSF